MGSKHCHSEHGWKASANAAGNQAHLPVWPCTADVGGTVKRILATIGTQFDVKDLLVELE